jgi:hypothetical protein
VLGEGARTLSRAPARNPGERFVAIPIVPSCDGLSMEAIVSHRPDFRASKTMAGWANATTSNICGET